MNGNRLVLSICGGSGSGKSSLAKELVEAIGGDRADRVPADFYLIGEGLAVNPSSPYRWDWDRLRVDLVGSDGTLVQTPRFDFPTMTRSASGSVMTYALRPIMIVDAMRPVPAADLVVRLDVPASERRSRLAARDLRWGRDVLANWDRLEATIADIDAILADLVLDGRQPLDALTRRAMAFIVARVGMGDP